MTIEEIFTKYWGQTTLILLGFAYFVKRILDNISKKKEINHTLFQEKRLEVSRDFFLAYAETKQMWNSIGIYNILNNQVSIKELDDIIIPVLNNLEKTILELEIYFDEAEHQKFVAVSRNTIAINKKLQELYFHYNSENTITDNAKEFKRFKEDRQKEDVERLSEISGLIKKTFK